MVTSYRENRIYAFEKGNRYDYDPNFKWRFTVLSTQSQIIQNEFNSLKTPDQVHNFEVNHELRNKVWSEMVHERNSIKWFLDHNKLKATKYEAIEYVNKYDKEIADLRDIKQKTIKHLKDKDKDLERIAEDRKLRLQIIDRLKREGLTPPSHLELIRQMSLSEKLATLSTKGQENPKEKSLTTRQNNFER